MNVEITPGSDGSPEVNRPSTTTPDACCDSPREDCAFTAIQALGTSITDVEVRTNSRGTDNTVKQGMILEMAMGRGHTPLPVLKGVIELAGIQAACSRDPEHGISLYDEQ